MAWICRISSSGARRLCFKVGVTRIVHKPGVIFVLLLVLMPAGCAELFEPGVDPVPGDRGVNRRMQLWQAAGRPTAVDVPVTTRPAEDSDPLLAPYRVNIHNIVRMMYERSPLVAASREEMVAARHGLEEFRSNLSRFEPFIDVTGNLSHYPERRSARGSRGELVGGIEKETFEGAVFRVESGVSSERVRFAATDDDDELVEQGSGTVIRARVEVPFVGSRVRQNRIISQAFQESTARRAMLDYLSDYSTYTSYAFQYYRTALLYLHYMQAYERRLAELEMLLELPKLSEPDRVRVQAAAGDARVLQAEYAASHWSNRLLLLQYLGLPPGDPYVIENMPDAPSRYLDRVRTADGMQSLLADAFENNPRFNVLEDAIADAELQRAQSILGRYDITAFLQGTQFPFGAESFDSRVGGWQFITGITVRLNDSRVLTASRRKAEAAILEYRSQIDAEQLSVQRQISQRAEKLVSLTNSQPQILENRDTATLEYEERKRAFLEGASASLTIDDVLSSLSTITVAEVRLAANRSNLAEVETALLVSTGEIYRMVGITIERTDHGAELSERRHASTGSALDEGRRSG